MQTEHHDNNTSSNRNSIHNIWNRLVRLSWAETSRPSTIYTEHFDNKNEEIYFIPFVGGNAENQQSLLFDTTV